ncbi:MAG: HAD family hydrolase [Sedimentisphaerales bacterium]|nr:HAD family hydrolase [Sedimentisphaerales bacterium]
MTERPVKAVMFDIGDTLLNFGRIQTMRVFRQSARLTYDYLVKMGQPAGNFPWYCLRNLIAVRLWNLWSDFTGRDFDALSLLKKSGEKRGFKLVEEQWREVGWLWYEPLSRIAKVEENIKETLALLSGMGLKLGILSNTFISAGSLDRHLAQLGILDFFPCRVYSYQFAFRKPDIRIFESATDRIGEAAENILFVGDRLDNDIWPALKAGMRAVLKSAYTNTGKNVPTDIRKIDRIAELPGIIEKINRDDGRQRTEDGGQKTEHRRRRTEDRIQKVEDRRDFLTLIDTVFFSHRAHRGHREI